MDCGLWNMDFLYMEWNKTRKKVCWLQIYAGGYYLGDCPMLSDYTSVLMSLDSVWFLFYNHFHYQIRF